MNVETGAEAALFPEKEYINRIAAAVRVACVVVKHYSKAIQKAYLFAFRTSAIHCLVSESYNSVIFLIAAFMKSIMSLTHGEI